MKLAPLGWAVSTALLLTGQAAADDGKEIYNKTCALCHAALSPKLGDKAAWEPRLKQGNDAMVAVVVKGKGAMPPNAGNAKLSEADIKAAVGYMVAQLK